MRPCNYCLLNRYKHEARLEGAKIIKRRSTYSLGGYVIFKVPKGTKLPPYKEPSDALPNGCEIYQKYFVAWMQEIPDHCTC